MRKRKVFICILATFMPILISALSICGYRLYTKGYGNKDYDKIVVKVAGDNNFPPYEYLDYNNNYTGFNVDIMRAVALVTGIEIEFYPMTWDEACEKLKKGEVDIIQGMKYTRERDLYFDFSDEYLENSQSIFVRASNDNIKGFKDLNGKRIALQRGDAAISTLYSLRHYTSVYAENQEESINLLIEGEADAFIGNTLTGVFLIDKMGKREKIKIVGETLNPTKYSMAVKDGDKELINRINEGLKKIKKEGTYDIIYRQWFGMPVDYTSSYLRRIIYIIIALVVLILAVAAMLFLKFNNMTKRNRQLNNRF